MKEHHLSSSPCSRPRREVASPSSGASTTATSPAVSLCRTATRRFSAPPPWGTMTDDTALWWNPEAMTMMLPQKKTVGGDTNVVPPTPLDTLPSFQEATVTKRRSTTGSNFLVSPPALYAAPVTQPRRCSDLTPLAGATSDGRRTINDVDLLLMSDLSDALQGLTTTHTTEDTTRTAAAAAALVSSFLSLSPQQQRHALTAAANNDLTARRRFLRTKLCPYYAKGFCANQQTCSYAHSQEELQPMPDLRKTKLCDVAKKGQTCQQPFCTYAHSVSELKLSSDLSTYKTSPCFFWKRSKCLNGLKCRFAHGDHELRPKAAAGAAAITRGASRLHTRRSTVTAAALPSACGGGQPQPITTTTTCLGGTDRTPSTRNTEEFFRSYATTNNSKTRTTASQPQPPSPQVLNFDSDLRTGVCDSVADTLASPSFLTQHHHHHHHTPHLDLLPQQQQQPRHTGELTGCRESASLFYHLLALAEDNTNPDGCTSTTTTTTTSSPSSRQHQYGDIQQRQLGNQPSSASALLPAVVPANHSLPTALIEGLVRDLYLLAPDQ